MKGETGFTPLHCAAEQNHPDIKLLLALGAEITEDENGITPIVLAQLLGNDEAVQALVQAI